MTIEEANIYLPQEEGLDPIDVYESKLFELKQFLTSHFPISKVVQAKIKRITLLNDAYMALGGAFEPVNEVRFDSEAMDNLVAAHARYVNHKSKFRVLIMNSNNGLQLIQLCRAYLEFIRLYAQVWKQDFDDFEGVLVGREPDDMELFHAIGAFGAQDKLQIHEATSLIDPKNVLLDESKRLSLWLKLDSNV